MQEMVTAEAERMQLKRKEQASREIIAEISRKLKVTLFYKTLYSKQKNA